MLFSFMPRRVSWAFTKQSQQLFTFHTTIGFPGFSRFPWIIRSRLLPRPPHHPILHSVGRNLGLTLFHRLASWDFVPDTPSNARRNLGQGPSFPLAEPEAPGQQRGELNLKLEIARHRHLSFRPPRGRALKPSYHTATPP